MKVIEWFNEGTQEIHKKFEDITSKLASKWGITDVKQVKLVINEMVIVLTGLIIIGITSAIGLSFLVLVELIAMLESIKITERITLERYE